MDFSASLAELQISVPKVKKDESVAITQSGTLSGLAYFGMRWDSLDAEIVKRFLSGSNGNVDLDIMAVALNQEFKGVLGSFEKSAITFRTLSNRTLGMARSKDDRSGSDSVTEKAINGNGKELTIDGRNADDERGYIDLKKIQENGGKYVLVTADLYGPQNSTFSTLKLKSAAKDGEAWLRIADASNIKQSVIDGYGEEPPTMVGNDIGMIDLDELGDQKGAMIGFFKLNSDDTWSWVTKVQPYPCDNAETFAKVFALLEQAPQKMWVEFFA
jgi:hypothetical protein